MKAKRVTVNVEAIQAAITYLRASLAYKEAHVREVTARVEMHRFLGKPRPEVTHEEWLVVQTRPHLENAIAGLELLLSIGTPEERR